MNDTINFNDELMKLLEEEEADDDNICLISGEKLEDNFISLECNHKFNYKSIYNEVHKQKTQPWHSEVNKVKKFQLKCPYCRNIQTGILPYRENYPKIKYVNWPPSLMMLPDECSYVFASGKRKGQVCSKKCSGKYCLSHTRIMEKREKKKLEKEKKKLEKEFQQQINELSPAMVNLILSTPNTSIVPHAANADALANVQIEQIMNVTTPTPMPVVVTCAYVFKKGKRKGENCQCKKIHKDGLCKLHYNRYLKKIENESFCKKIPVTAVKPKGTKIKNVSIHGKNTIITV